MLEVGLTHFTVLSLIIFAIGIVGLAYNRKNIISILICLELVLLSCNLNFVAGSAFFKDVEGQIYTFFTLSIAAAEVAIGLALIVALFKQIGSINLDKIK
ncbi:MAG: NADH-quinone oxidoreductase subunit K [Proteobacteria bacterium]|jgi:NADH-quinone oxidoreductase subunit K|nr:MAG: NADH-quinone oxidoreductase subunit K [Pseudomonadota bacterium]|tara:strand:+ start:117 stop:416 length:300 start_codon:yes stop_codon:yes gene_type:complete